MPQQSSIMTRVRKTDDQNMADMTCLFDEIFDLKDKVDHPIRGAMTMANVDNVRDLLAMEIQGHEKLKCSAKDDKDKTTNKLLPEHSIGALQSFKRLIACYQLIGASSETRTDSPLILMTLINSELVHAMWTILPKSHHPIPTAMSTRFPMPWTRSRN